ncbi:MAG: sulfatase [Actinomycetota bacterium]|nr:sulfatase [Actinomycetota bacterium]
MCAENKSQLRLGAGVCVLSMLLVLFAAAAATEAPAKGKTKAEPKRERLQKLRQANARQKRPNVIVVMTDDQNESMLGMDLTQRLLGAQGTTFRNSYVSFPLCCPSRATFLTGQYRHNHGVFTTELPNGYNGLNHTNTLPVWLRSSGYRTAMVGKYLNGYGINDFIPERVSDAREIPPGWSEWYGLTGGLEQRRYRYKLNEQGRIRRYKRGPKNYVTDVLAGKAVDFVNRRARFPKPFFLWFNPTAPHGEAARPLGATRDPEPARRHLGRYEFAVAPRTPNFDEADVSDKPEAVETTPRLSAEDIADVDRRYRGRLESLLAVDDAVKRIVGKLKKANDLRRTYIFFTSDNGLLLGAHRLLFKNFIYEESTRVPLIVRGPQFPAGGVRDQPVSNVDLAPTIVSLTGVSPGLVMDGRSLVPVAQSPTFGSAREILFESEVNGGSVGIRSGPWVYINNGPENTAELYNLDSDPFQLKSLHASALSQHVTIRNQLAAKVSQYRFCSGLSCP